MQFRGGSCINQKCKFLGKDVRVEVQFWVKNAGGKLRGCGDSVVFGLKMGIGGVEKCFKV